MLVHRVVPRGLMSDEADATKSRRPAGIAIDDCVLGATGIAVDDTPTSGIAVDVAPRSGIATEHERERAADGHISIGVLGEPMKLGFAEAKQIARHDLDTAKVLGLDAKALRAGLISAQAAAGQLSLFLDRLRKLEEKDKTLQRAASEEPEYGRWLAGIRRIRSETAVDELRAIVEGEAIEVAMAALRADARVHLSDGHLEWAEHQKMRWHARRLGLHEDHLEDHIEAVYREFGAFTRESEAEAAGKNGPAAANSEQPRATALQPFSPPDEIGPGRGTDQHDGARLPPAIERRPMYVGALPTTTITPSRAEPSTDAIADRVDTVAMSQSASPVDVSRPVERRRGASLVVMSCTILVFGLVGVALLRTQRPDRVRGALPLISPARAVDGPVAAAATAYRDPATDGLSWEHRDPRVSRHPVALAIGDIDGDHAVDLVIATEMTIEVLFGGLPNRTASVMAAGGVPNDMVCADFDRDGSADIVVAHPDGRLLVLRWDASSGLVTTDTLRGGGGSMIARDLDGDGVPDIAVVDESRKEIIVFPMGATSTRTPRRWATRATPFGLSAGDFNGDGIVDLATADYHGHRAIVIPGLGNGLFGSPRLIAADLPAIATAAADINQDGRDDLVIGGPDSGVVAILLGDAENFLRLTGRVQVATSFGGLALADLDGDHLIDLVASDAVEHSVQILRGLGQGEFHSSAVIGFDSALLQDSLKAGDLDGDGRWDLVVLPATGTSVMEVLSRRDGRGTHVGGSSR